jgi:hypothetical protein
MDVNVSSIRSWSQARASAVESPAGSVPICVRLANASCSPGSKSILGW